MLGLRVAVKDAERARKALKALGVLEERYAAQRSGDCLLFPLKERPLKGFEFGEFCDTDFERLPPRNLGEALGEMGWSERELALLPRGFDTIGDIAIIEVPNELRRREKEIGGVILELNPGIKVVAVKGSAVKGVFRIRELRVVAGERRLTTLHREHGCSYKVDLEHVFFTPRLAFERARIASLVRAGERVLVLFAGVGVYAIAIAKRVPSARVVGIELNPAAVELFRENVRLNRVANCEVVEGDVRELAPRFADWAERVVMPLPLHVGGFLDVALVCASRQATLHIYTTCEQNKAFERAQEVVAFFERAGASAKLISHRVVGHYAPHVDKIVLDIELRK